MQRSAERQAFDFYLRTGRRHPPAAFIRERSLEMKFNPYHDPLNGQFTFGPGGTRGARMTRASWRDGGSTDSGGKLFGGGGASASWDVAPRASNPAPRQSDPRTPRRAGASSVAAGAQNHVVVQNGYVYHLDGSDRTTSVAGTLTLTSSPQRSRSAQAGAGGSDRLPTDDGGHYIAARFNGPTDTFNHFAQDANFNRGGYRMLEDGWAKDVKAGKQVYVSIIPTYAGSSKRPSSINVVYSVDGRVSSQPFTNRSKGKAHAK